MKKRVLTWGAAVTVVVTLGISMTVYYYGFLVPLRQENSHLADAREGNWSDLYPHWLAARELLIQGRNPYSREVTVEIQRGFYGRPLDNARPADPTDQEAFTYPVYAVFFLAPTIVFPFEAVRIVIAILLFLLTAASVPLWMHAMGWRNRRWVVVWVIGTLSSYAVLDGLHLQQPTLLVAALAAGAVAALATGRYGLTGMLLGFATIKPQLVALLIVWIMAWTLGSWKSRKRVMISFLTTVAILAVSAELLLPGWVGDWLRAAQQYLTYTREPLMIAVFGPVIGKLAIIGAVVGSFGLFWHVRRHLAGSSSFNFALVTAMLVPLLVSPTGRATYNEALLLPAVLWLFHSHGALRKTSAVFRGAWFIATSALAWQWILATAILLTWLIAGTGSRAEANTFVITLEGFVALFPLSFLPIIWITGRRLVQAPLETPLQEQIH